MSDLNHYINKLQDIDGKLTKDTPLKNRAEIACEMIEVADNIMWLAVQELENLIMYKQQVLESNQYTDLFTYYHNKQQWNFDIIIRLIEQEKLGKLPILNGFCKNNMKYLVLTLIEALKSGVGSLIYDNPIDESIESLNYYFNIILDNCPAEDKENTAEIINEMKQEFADSFADRIAENKKAEFDELREEHYNNSYIADCEAVLKFAPNNKQALSLKNYFLEQKIEDMENGLDRE